MSTRPCPIEHLTQASRPFAEVLGQEFEQRQQLHRTQSNAQQHHDQQPASQLERARQRSRAPQCDKPHQRIGPRNQQRIVDQFRVARENHDADDSRTRSNIRDRAKALHAFFFLLADNQLDDCQQQRQPHHRGDKHGKDHTHNHKAAKHKGQPAKKCRKPMQPQHATKQIHIDPSQPDLNRGEPAICSFEWQNKEEDAQRIKGT